MERLADSRFLRQSLALFGCMMISAGSVRAEIILVPDDYRTIQEAIDAAAGGDEIIVAPGTYAERINFLGKAIWLHSAVGADATIIDGSGLYEAVVTCNYGEGPDTVFEGFTITGGDGYWGGGMYIHNSSPTVLDCTFTANYAAYGGGLCNFYETPIIAECTFIDNAAGSGGGLYSRTSDPIIRECVFLENIAGSFGGGVGGLGECEPDVSGCVFIGNMAQSGGAFHTQLTSPQFTDCLFEANRAWSKGGAIGLTGGEPRMARCIFRNNLAYMDGAGFCQEWCSQATITDCLFEANRTHRSGGGIYSRDADCTVVDCTFAGNHAQRGGGMTVGDSHSLALRCTFEGNTATGSGGGLSSGDSPLTVCRCVFRANNAGSLGGGIVNVQGDPVVTQCLFVDNTSGGGGGFGNDDGDGDPHITGCTFHGNSGAVAGGIYNGGDDLVASGCIFWGNENAEIWGSPDETLVTYSLLEDYWPGEGNLFVDPQFVDEAGDDFRLAPGSPCIDAADNTAVPADEYDLDDDGDVDEPIPYDLDGNTRFVDDPETEDTGHGEPPIVDMGAYEYQVDSCPADFNDDGFVNAADLLFLLGAWGTPDGDVDDDDDTDAQDLLILLGAWGECPE